MTTINLENPLSLILQDILKDPSVTDIELQEFSSIWIRNENGFGRWGAEPLAFNVLKEFLSSQIYGGNKPEEALSHKGGSDDAGIVLGQTRMRATIYVAGGLLNLILRVHPKRILQFEELGLPSQILEYAMRPVGINLVTGGLNSGKSTTLHSIIDYLNRTQALNILTLEDPIEPKHVDIKSRVIQREVGEGKDCISFEKGLEAALRSDINVLLGGEIRNAQTMAFMIEAARTGQLSMATVHTNGAMETVSRVAGFFEGANREAALQGLSELLNIVVSQVRLRDKDKKVVIACEILIPTPAIRNAIKENKMNTIYQEMMGNPSHGHVLLNSSLAKLVQEDRITLEQAKSVSRNPHDLIV